ncbi:PREDICTED: RNA exonuclease 1 homolog [Nanorana parkeri]|uniref:RNA exonuclease 1 homolog n=1 Tax=Nanorana parkeri TaxID=125878 RepID=UPI0008547DDE|nr:PREDICTED: RNA exonuclease 1 homolog [Nanorana parkeri]
MLRSAGFFQLLPCPYTRGSGGCARPHCHFQHVSPKVLGEQSGDVSNSPSVLGPPREALGKKFSELEKLKKAIETVKNEVEESQKKLLLYTNVTHTVQDILEVDSNCNILDTIQDEEKTRTNKNHDRLVTCSKNNKKKYVVDRSCPATDLEYDPLLNYTAGFFSSSTKENENKTTVKQKCEELFDNPQKKPRTVSPIRLEIKLQESDDEDMLVIDAPPLEVAPKRKRPSKVSVTIEKQGSLDEADVSTEESGATMECEILAPVDEASDTNGDSETNEAEASHNILTTCTNDGAQQYENPCDAQISLAENTTSNVNEPKNYGADISVKSEESAEEQTNEMLENIDKPDSFCLLSEKSLDLCDNEVVQNSSVDFEITEEDSATTALDITAANTLLIDEHKSQPETLYIPKKAHHEVIVVNSSTDDSSEEDTISDSEDPMDECLRIFNEFTECEAKKNSNQQPEEQPEEQPDAELQVKGSELLPGQRKRIAHPSAKSDVKESSTILVPFRRSTPHQIPSQRIVQVHQQAVQISSAVKSGQAFIASSQKRTASSMSPAFHTFGQMVCFNLVEVQPFLPARSQISGQGSTLFTTVKSGFSQKRTIQTTPVKIPCRRRASVIPESTSKVPHETRQRYVNSFVEEFLKESSSVQEAFDKALTEEKSIYDRCGSKNMYLSIAVNSLKKLRDQHNNNGPKYSSRREVAGSRKQDDKNELTGHTLYNFLKEYLLSEDQLIENGYPRPNPEKPGSALIPNAGGKNINSDALRRVCCRCGEVYAVTMQSKHVRKEECTYHSGRVRKHRVPGGMETRYSCCEAAVGAPGCQMAKLHVHEGQKENLDGFIKTFPKLQPSDENPGIFSVDCEMCYTTHGLELTRVTVVNHSLQVVYDTFVKPDNEIIDYNTGFSGITEDNLKNNTTSIRDVQAIMLNLFSADAILIGHSLENDLIALKLIHDTIIDTSMVFPHRLGLPHKRALRYLIADYLRRIIQDNVAGHDSIEDATACMELMLWKVKEDTKGRR